MNTETELVKQIAQTVNEGLGKAIAEKCGQYNGPLSRLVDLVIESRSAQLRKLIEEAVDAAMFGDMRTALQEALTHKLARLIAAKTEGAIEKKLTELRQSPEAMAKITLAISKAINEL